MHNNIGGSNQSSSDGYELLRKRPSGHHHEHHHKKDINQSVVNQVSVSSVTSMKASFFTSSVNEDGGYKILAQALSVKFSTVAEGAGSAGSNVSQAALEPPSPLDVANRVLGFVESRLNSELEAGADSERISNLISQAREGVQKGFSQARDDIESLGLMTEKLNAEIGSGYDRIQQGLDDIEEGFGSASKALNSTDGLGGMSDPVKSVSVTGAQYFQEAVLHSKSADGGQVGVSGQSYFKHDSEFTLMTQDGDTISIRYMQEGGGGFQSSGQNLFFNLNQFQGYQLEVNGELDEGELAAITDLFSQLGEVSSLFFEGDFQDAFVSALDVGFDASEIASFSLDLSKVQVQEVSTYSNSGVVGEQVGADLGAMMKNQSLIDMAGTFERSLELLKKFDDQQFDFRELILESISRDVIEKDVPVKVSQNDFSDFTKKLFELLVE